MLRCKARKALVVRRTLRTLNDTRRSATQQTMVPFRVWAYCKILRLLPARNIIINYCASLAGMRSRSKAFLYHKNRTGSRKIASRARKAQVATSGCVSLSAAICRKLSAVRKTNEAISPSAIPVALMTDSQLCPCAQ